MFRKLTDLFYSMRFGQRLCIILILFALIPMLLIQQILMHFYEKHIVDSASNSACASGLVASPSENAVALPVAVPIFKATP